MKRGTLCAKFALAGLGLSSFISFCKKWYIRDGDCGLTKKKKKTSHCKSRALFTREAASKNTRKSALELHYGRKPNTEISNVLKLDTLEIVTKIPISAKPDTLQIYVFNGVGSVSEQLPLEQEKNEKKLAITLFFFLFKKHQKSKLESAYTDKPKIAVSGTEPTVTTSKYRILHTKRFSKPILEFN